MSGCILRQCVFALIIGGTVGGAVLGVDAGGLDHEAVATRARGSAP